MAEKGMANGVDSGKRVVVRVDTIAKERIREYVRRPSEKCSDEVLMTSIQNQKQV